MCLRPRMSVGAGSRTQEGMSPEGMAQVPGEAVERKQAVVTPEAPAEVVAGVTAAAGAPETAGQVEAMMTPGGEMAAKTVAPARTEVHPTRGEAEEIGVRMEAEAMPARIVGRTRVDPGGGRIGTAEEAGSRTSIVGRVCLAMVSLIAAHWTEVRDQTSARVVSPVTVARRGETIEAALALEV